MFSSFIGKTYGQARHSFNKAVLCGFLDSATGQAHLNPADSCVLTEQHRLVFLSSTANIKPSKQVACLAETPSYCCMMTDHHCLVVLVGAVRIKPPKQVACLAKSLHYCCKLYDQHCFVVLCSAVKTKCSKQVACLSQTPKLLLQAV